MSQEWPNMNRSLGSRRSTKTNDQEVPGTDLGRAKRGTRLQHAKASSLAFGGACSYWFVQGLRAISD